MLSTDPLHDPGLPESHWSTDNVGEAAPGVLTPLSCSLWAPVGARMPRRIAHTMGVFSRRESHGPAPGEDLIVRPFYGRLAIRLEYLAVMGDRMPGTRGEDAVSGLCGRVPDTMVFAPTRRRYPIVSWKLPRAMLAAPRQVRALAPVTDAWWRDQIQAAPALGLEQATDLLREGTERFEFTLTTHSLALMGVMQPLLDTLTRLVADAGVGDVGALSGSGGAELAIIADIWRASRGEIGIEQVIANHGFHGPLEGELSSRVWREEPAPLKSLIREYEALDDEDSPLGREARSRAQLPDLQRELLAALPARRRPAARRVLTLAARNLPLRGVGKRSFLQSFDVTRAAARRLGELLTQAGQLEAPDDVFYLTVDELRQGAAPAGARDLVTHRRERRAQYEALRLPGSWRGIPVPEPLGDDDAVLDAGELVTGIGVSQGTVEGTVHVVTDPTFADVEPGTILVTPTTDPSWASIMFVSAGLVVDIGGPLSHAAVVARELGLPCVVNTRSGTRSLRSGDRVRVDGGAGTVEVLERA
jgi:pyruvate,water dikinase